MESASPAARPAQPAAMPQLAAAATAASRSFLELA